MNPPTPTAPRPWLRFLPPLLVALITAAVFLPSLGGEFLNWDDDTNFLNNPYYRGLGPGPLKWMFTDYFGHYMPITWLTLGLDYALWGMNPAGYHATNLILHALNAVLCFLLLRNLLRLARPEGEEATHLWIATVAALFFSIHPLRVESVAWITERRDLTSGTFFFLTLLAWLKGLTDRKWYWISVVAFAAMILCKAMGMTLPLVLLVLDFYPLRRFTREKAFALIREKAPFFVILAAAVAMTVVGQRKADALYSSAQYPIAQSLAQPGYRVFFYLLKTLVPVPLSPLYWFRGEIGALQAVGWLGVVVTTGVTWTRRRDWPAALACWLAYGILIAPVAGLFQAGAHYAADRYSYLACLPFAALAAALLLRASESGAARIARPVAAALLVGLSFLSIRQCAIWHDSIALWNHVIRLDPDLYLPYNNRGTARAERGDWKGAIEDYDMSISIWPSWQKPWFNRGVARATQGDHIGAIEDFTRALQIDPRHADAYASRALSRSKKGDATGAAADCDEALRLKPDDPGLLMNRGIVKFERGDLQGAIADYTRALELLPTAETYKNRGLAWSKAGRFAEAEADYGLSLKLRADPATFVRRATVRGVLGDLDGAIADCSEAIRCNPGFGEAYVRRGIARLERKDGAGAAQDFAKALEVSPPDWNQRRQVEELLRRARE